MVPIGTRPALRILEVPSPTKVVSQGAPKLAERPVRLVLTQEEIVARIPAIVAFAVSFGLIVYDSWFLRKTRMLR
jgi:hypothetical protein